MALRFVHCRPLDSSRISSRFGTIGALMRRADFLSVRMNDPRLRLTPPKSALAVPILY